MEKETLHPTSCMYAIVCSETTASLWSSAKERLRLKYEAKWPGTVSVITYSADLTSVCDQLSKLMPSYTCFLVHHSECGRTYVQTVNKLTRTLDPSHTYTDTIWGILTGLSEEDVLFALEQDRLEIKRVVGNCPVNLDKFFSGVWYSELEQGAVYRKESYQSAILKGTCGPDATELFVGEIGVKREGEEGGVDMVITSGHATESELNLGYTFRGGQIRCRGGQLYGCPVNGERIELPLTASPKILSAAGNCLMGHISDRHSMALGWLHSASVVQMVGYIVETWFGYGGWGVHKYFVNNPGSMSFAEAFYANQQSLLHEIAVHSTAAGQVMSDDHSSVYRSCFDTKNTAIPGLSRYLSGLLYDRDNVAFYGDPAWEARLTYDANLHDYQSVVTKLSAMDDGWTHWEYRIFTLKDGRWDCPIPDDKDTSPGRPPIYVFPCAVNAARLVRGHGVVTSRFVLLALSGCFKAGEKHSLTFATR